MQLKIIPKNNTFDKKNYRKNSLKPTSLLPIKSTYRPIPKIRVPIRNIADYSPFGVQLDGRTIQGDFYRRGFNGMEKDDEVKGGGNSYTTEFRQYDPRLGRWLSLDPIEKKYPSFSPYSAFNNNPIYFIDPKGLEGEDPKSSKTEKGAGNKELKLPQDAVVKGRFVDKDKNGVINHGKKILDAKPGDVDRFSVGDKDYVPNFNSKGKFNGYVDKAGEMYTFKENKVKQDLTLNIVSSSTGVSVGGLGGELDAVGWQYYGINSTTGKGWDEGSQSLKMHDFSILNSGGVGTSLDLIPKESIEVLAIGGGDLHLKKEYLNKHPTTSLLKLLNNKNITTIYGGCGYKVTYLEIWDDKEMEIIATGTIHSFALCLPGAGARQGKTSLYK
ncbi:MAG: RHS repeat-associated core domain-containing protein [Flavobacteriales bacterium]|nr:RHS repeat-associated core domain-containing protein [Flavobacteriales bacterium]